VTEATFSSSLQGRAIEAEAYAVVLEGDVIKATGIVATSDPRESRESRCSRLDAI
jgi:hypothetical protein